jgi:hypothetical protein
VHDNDISQENSQKSANAGFVRWVFGGNVAGRKK